MPTTPVQATINGSSWRRRAVRRATRPVRAAALLDRRAGSLQPGTRGRRARPGRIARHLDGLEEPDRGRIADGVLNSFEDAKVEEDVFCVERLDDECRGGVACDVQGRRLPGE